VVAGADVDGYVAYYSYSVSCNGTYGTDAADGNGDVNMDDDDAAGTGYDVGI